MIFCIFLSASSILPTKEEILISNFLKTFYTFKNNSLPVVSEYTENYPNDDISYKLKEYMNESAFNKLISAETQKKYILQSYDSGFDSNCNIIKINKISNSDTYTFQVKVNIFFSDIGLKESYNIKGSCIINNFNDSPKITYYTNIKSPAIGTSTTLSKLV